MIRLFSLLAVALMVCAVVVPAKAADEAKKKKPAPDLAKTFKDLDKDNDGKLTKEEFLKFTPTQKKVAASFKADEVFDKAVADKKDKSLTLEEFKKVTEGLKKKKAAK